jgi:DNA-binding transcriptional ArsR family regulator
LRGNRREFRIAYLEALAHPTRYRIMAIIAAAGPAGIRSGDVTAKAGIPLSSASQHLAKLADAGLTTPRRASTAVTYSPADRTLRDLVDKMSDLFLGRGAEAPGAVQSAWPVLRDEPWPVSWQGVDQDFDQLRSRSTVRPAPDIVSRQTDRSGPTSRQAASSRVRGHA